jgi:hypothetical protein
MIRIFSHYRRWSSAPLSVYSRSPSTRRFRVKACLGHRAWKRQRLQIDQPAHACPGDTKGNRGSRAPDQPADRTVALASPRLGAQRPDQAILQRWLGPGGGEEAIQALIQPASLAQLGGAGLTLGGMRFDTLRLRGIQSPRHKGGQVLTHPGMLRHD